MKVETVCSNTRFSPILRRSDGEITPDSTISFIPFEPHTGVKRRGSRRAQSSAARTIRSVKGVANDHATTNTGKPLSGHQWLLSESQQFQNDFWELFVAPAQLTARSSNAWPPFQSHATFVLDSHDFKRHITAAEVWSIIRTSHANIADGWQAAVDIAVGNHTTDEPYRPPKKRNVMSMSTRDGVTRSSQASSRYQIPGAGSSALVTPPLANSWSQAPTLLGSPTPDLDCIDAGWNNFLNEILPLAPQVGAKVLIPTLSQERIPPTPSGVYLHPSGYSLPASAASFASSPLAFAGPSYFAALPSTSRGSYLPQSEHLCEPNGLGNGNLLLHQPLNIGQDPYSLPDRFPSSLNDIPNPSFEFYQRPMVSGYDFHASVPHKTNQDHAGSWDTLSHQTQLYPGPPSRNLGLYFSVPGSKKPHTTTLPGQFDHRHSEPSQAAPKNDFGHQIDLDFSLQPLYGSFPEAPLVGPDTDHSSFLPDLGQALESHHAYTQRLCNSFDEYPERSSQTGSGVEDLFGSYNGPVGPDFAFDARGANPVPNFDSPDAYEPLVSMGIDLWGPA